MIYFIVARRLAQEGYPCVMANNGREALGYFYKDNFSLIISDIRMPEMSGLELLKNVKAAPPNMRKQAEMALKESEVKHRIVADNTYDWEWWLSPEDKFLYSSPSCKRITNHEPKEFLVDPDLFFRIILPEDQPIFLKHRSEVEQGLLQGEVEFRVVRSDGSYRWIGHVCQPVFDEGCQRQCGCEGDG